MRTKKKSSQKHVQKQFVAAPSKTEFILGLPRDMPAADVIARASDAGISLTNRYIYAIRSSYKKKARMSAGRAKKAAKKPSSVKGRAALPVNSAGVEARFVDLALDVGLSRAEELLAKLRTKVRRILL